eukprot:scaffold112761_cov46-Cyclotella_meneghiniana.AAC.11
MVVKEATHSVSCTARPTVVVKRASQKQVNTSSNPLQNSPPELLINNNNINNDNNTTSNSESPIAVTQVPRHAAEPQMPPPSRPPSEPPDITAKRIVMLMWIVSLFPVFQKT